MFSGKSADMSAYTSADMSAYTSADALAKTSPHKMIQSVTSFYLLAFNSSFYLTDKLVKEGNLLWFWFWFGFAASLWFGLADRWIIS